MVRICDDPDESKGICFLGGGCRGKGTGRRGCKFWQKISRRRAELVPFGNAANLSDSPQQLIVVFGFDYNVCQIPEQSTMSLHDSQTVRRSEVRNMTHPPRESSLIVWLHKVRSPPWIQLTPYSVLRGRPYRGCLLFALYWSLSPPPKSSSRSPWRFSRHQTPDPSRNTFVKRIKFHCLAAEGSTCEPILPYASTACHRLPRSQLE